MTNTHFIRYTHWKKSTFLLVAGLLIALTITHAYYYYKLYTTQQKVKVTCMQPGESGNNKQLVSIIQEIDQHELYSILNALLENLPPSVKIEKLEYNRTGSIISSKAQNHNAMVALLEACSKNSILKKFTLRKSTQENGELLFVLA